LWQRFVKCCGLAGQRLVADGIEEDACVQEGENLKAFQAFLEVIFLPRTIPFFSPDANKVVHCGNISLEYYG